jgi:hypothetical protein
MSDYFLESIPISPDAMNASADDPCWKGYKQIGMKEKNGKMVPNCVPDTALTADADYGDECPPATQDIVLNINNRQNAIDNVGYGPLNPNEPSTEFWQDKADKWSVSPEDAKKSVCGNCVFFDIRQKTLECIETGIAEGGSGDESAWGAIDKAELGYCTALDFKCAASRTCNAWAVGGPVVDEDQTAEEAIAAAGYIVEEEWDLADALVEIAEEHGKFNEDRTGIWAGYKPAAENEYASMGVKCGNCVLYRGGSECAIIDFEVESEGKCRFAVIPDGVVDVSKAPIGEDKDVNTGVYFNKSYKKMSPRVKSRCEEDEPYDEYDMKLSDLSPTQRTVNMRRVEDVYDSDKPIKVWMTQDGARVIDGHHRTVAHRLQGKESIRAKVYRYAEEEAAVASGGAGTILPVLVKGAIKKPSKGPNLETVMSKPKKIRYSRSTELSLRQKLVEHNATADESCLATLDMFKAVYRRGAGAFATSGKPDQERDKLAMSRVAAFSHLLKAGEPKNSSYTADNDLLPTTHSKSSMSSEGMTASGLTKYEEALTVSILPEDEYESREHAVFALAEYSGLGYETIPAIRAAWIRGIKNNENPFERAAVLASALYNSPDADLLPKKGTL